MSAPEGYDPYFVFPENLNFEDLNSNQPRNCTFGYLTAEDEEELEREISMEDKVVLVKILKSKKFELLNKVGCSSILDNKNEVKQDLKKISKLKREIKKLKKNNFWKEFFFQILFYLCILMFFVLLIINEYQLLWRFVREFSFFFK
jgi:hypothetical protein